MAKTAESARPVGHTGAHFTPPTVELDLRTIPPRDRHPLIFGRFDALAIGQSLQLVNDHNPQPLRYQFARIADAAVPSAGTTGDSCCSGGACCG